MNTTHNHNQGGHVYATATIPVQGPQQVGTTHAPDVRDAPRVYRWRVVGPLVLALILVGCIPVTVRPQFDDQGLPIALPVTPTGSVSVDGTITPIYPVSTNAPTPFNWGAVVATVSGILNALLLAYGINLRGFATKAKTALQIACDLADQNAHAETDQDVERNKMIAAQRQASAGVMKLTQAVRGKT